MERWCGKVAVVTGASAGIGAAVCERLVTEGLQVVGLARRVERINELSNKLSEKTGKLYGVKCDICKTEDIINAFKWVKENLGNVYILINNAGILKSGTILENNFEDLEAIIKTNVLGLTLCTKEAVKQMKEKDIAGHIINVNSVGGHANINNLNIYSPSKFAVTSLTKVIKHELLSSGTKIKISSISPGTVTTEIVQAAKIEQDLTKIPHLDAKDIADAIAYLLSTPPHVLIQELTITATDSQL